MPEKEDYEKLEEMIEKESEKPKGKLFCPECGSPSLYYFLGLYTGYKYVCKECGYRGPVVIEDGVIAEKLRKEKVKELEKEDGEDESSEEKE